MSTGARVGGSAKFKQLTTPVKPIFHWLASGFCANFIFCVEGNANFSVFRYQHVGIPNAKFHVGGLSQQEDPTQVFLCRSGI